MSLLRHAEECLENIAKHKALNAFVPNALGHSVALKGAQAAVERASQGTPLSKIDGRLIAIKDNICTLDHPTSCASRVLEGFQSPFQAEVVRRLQAAGAVVVGKTNLDEFGMGSHTTNSIYGATYNSFSHGNPGDENAPDGWKTASAFDPEADPYSAGGSSGGSAVAASMGQCWAAIGTDTGGSVRLPAAYTGCYGFKPSYGMISRHGVIPYANSLDTVGIMATNRRIVKDVFEVTNGYDPQDPTSLGLASRTRIEKAVAARKSNKSLRIGVPVEYNVAEISDDVRSLWVTTLRRLQEAGHTVKMVSLPSTHIALSAYYILAPAEASSNLAKYDGVRYGNKSSLERQPEHVLYAQTRGEGFGEEVRRRILLGAYTLSSTAIDNYFIQAQKIRRLVQKDFDRVFAFPNLLHDVGDANVNADGVDVLLTPTATTMPPKLRELAGRSPVDSYRDDVLTVPASLAGLPAMSVPLSDGNAVLDDFPRAMDSIGMQLIAQYGDEDMIFRAAESLDYDDRRR